MAKADCTPNRTLTKTDKTRASSQRCLKVGYSPNGGYPNPKPQLTIKGNW